MLPRLNNYALEEEIGDPDLFVGRRQDLETLLNWVDLVGRKLGKSKVILARKRRGKTALIQRLFNILFDRGDAKAIPFYFRVPQVKMTTWHFSELFLHQLIRQYVAFKSKEPSLVVSEAPALVIAGDDPFLIDLLEQMEHFVSKGDRVNSWRLAREAGFIISVKRDERIIQLIDEFQFLDEYIFLDQALTRKDCLTSAYQHTASLKPSPQIITGSYIGWLGKIVRQMVGRYRIYKLGEMPPEEAEACVFRYATYHKVQINDENAAYLAAACHNDPYYIATLFESQMSGKDLHSPEGIRAVLNHETDEEGEIGSMWKEYIHNAFDRVNDRIAKKLVLYLAHHEPEERKLSEIITDLNLDMEPDAVAERLDKLAHADIIKKGMSSIRYQGLGDPIFAMVFRKIYQEEIDNIPGEQIRADIMSELKQLKGRVGYYKGMAAEERVAKKLTLLSLRQGYVSSFLIGAPDGMALAPFQSVHAYRFQFKGGQTSDVDLYCRSEQGPNLVVEVKDWEQKPGLAQRETFISLVEDLKQHLDGQHNYLFYSEHPLTEEARQHLNEHGIWYSDGSLLADF